MLARTPWRLMAFAPLITPQMAEAASVRAWGLHDAKRLAMAVTSGVYPMDEAQRELATTLAWHAQNARIRSVSCNALAADMLEDEVDALEVHQLAVRARMIDAAEAVLRADPRRRRDAAHAAADIARAENMPVDLIDAAFNIALWRTRRRA
jgi:hypothetical protein